MDPITYKMEPREIDLTDPTLYKLDRVDLDVNFEPQVRSRSNTWPLPRPDDYVDDPSPINVKTKEYETLGALLTDTKCGGTAGLNTNVAVNTMAGVQLKKSNTSRRNAWGSSSYADLISQAINSSPEKRLTLSQIYDWMIQNVAYFKDKGDSNSSAGWKNSIRHNLSLHSKFMRVQNEGTGKSSWWMLNPDAKAGKSARRRAASMETSKFEKRRGRVKKKVEALRNGITPSPSSSVSESLDLFPDSPNLHFQLSPDYRQRASSNASSCGRLSPIPQDNQQWLPYTHPYTGAEQLAGSLEQTMKLGSEPNFMQYPSPPPYRNQASPNYVPPPPYPCPHHLVANSCNCQNHPQSISPSYNSPSSSPPATVMGQVLSSLNPTMLDEFNLNIESLQGLDCNVDEVIRHELSMEGGFDFNFPASTPMIASTASAQPCTTTSEQSTAFSTSGQSWVH